jgi:peptidoglycan hydrolase-like protein with peptidoglycan-binding domain
MSMNTKNFLGISLAALLFISSALPAFAQTATVTSYITGSASVAVPNICPQLSYNLYRGVSDYWTGGQVSALQQFLNTRYGNQLVTGYYGLMTTANVAQFQREQNVYPITGGVGPLTRAAIARVCNVGTIPPPTSGGLSAWPSSGTAPLAVTFTASLPDTNQYIIEFGDGTNSGPFQGTLVNHTYSSSGTYTATLSRYISCMYSNPRCMIAVQNIGQTTVLVSAPVQTNTLSVTNPVAGQTYARGTDMTISWSGLIRQTFAYEQHASIVDLYTATGIKVGTIAITNDLSGSTQWRIPPFPNNLMCTMQYPNGLCGQNVQGQYYIKVTAVVGSGFETNSTVIATAQSGIFTVQ